MEVIDQATLAALLASVVVLVNKISSYVDRLAAKKNGGTSADHIRDLEKRVTLIESQHESLASTTGEMETKLDRFHRDMMEFREEARINAASMKSYLQGRKEGETNG